jgi:putative phosphoesterase
MKIAILSDIHDHVQRLAAALAQAQSADSLICCGDLCSPFIIPQLGSGFAGKPVHIVFGNNDGDLFRITRNAANFPHLQLHGEFFEGDFDGKRLAVVHYDTLARPLIRSGLYEVVCYGHNHHFCVEMEGRTLGINPGPIMGFEPGQGEVDATFVLYDTASGAWERRVVP